MRSSISRRAFLAGGLALGNSLLWMRRSVGTEQILERIHGGGWIRDSVEPKDKFLITPQFSNPGARPPAVDLSAKMPPVYDQGLVGSCTANAIAAALQYARRVHKKPDDFTPSRLFIYYEQRKSEDSLDIDVGGQLRNGILSIAKIGVCPESDWPYDNVAGDPKTHRFPANAQALKAPPSDLVKKAGKFRTISYEPLSQDIEVLESCIAGGYPFLFGFNVYGKFTEATTALRMPGPSERTVLWGMLSLLPVMTKLNACSESVTPGEVLHMSMGILRWITTTFSTQ
ncbi:C1 family peptidase [Pseudomonas sp. CCI1.2]|nr:C1 family peptidase [Pseudomonas sp. CCI1.2]MEB0123480.1 C1 family peptidase [Pseudomonas sp. CCI1.2]